MSVRNFFGIICFFFLMTSSVDASVNKDQKSDLLRIYSLAGKGQIPNSEPFGVGSKVEDVKKSWGEPDTNLYEMIFGYWKQKVMFTRDDMKEESIRGDVTAVTPFSEETADISLATLIRELGEPTHKKIPDSDEMIVCYDTNGYHLQFFLDYEDGGYQVSSYMVSSEFMPQFLDE